MLIPTRILSCAGIARRAFQSSLGGTGFLAGPNRRLFHQPEPFAPPGPAGGLCRLEKFREKACQISVRRSSCMVKKFAAERVLTRTTRPSSLWRLPLISPSKERFMATVRDILAVKGNHIESIAPTATVFEAAVRMNNHKIGALLVLDEERLVGIVTERDILQRLVAQRRDAAETLVEEIMTTEVACCQRDTSLEEARGVMKNRRIRHLPVVDEGERLLALISIGDLNAYQSTAQEQTIHLLHEYIYGLS
jgi:CBS domain-containing protein